MATLPDASTLGLPTPQANMGVASYQPHTRMEGMAGAYEQQAGGELQQAGDILKNYQDKQDEIVAQDALNKLKQSSLNLANDPDNGFTNVKGNAVVGPQFVKQYQNKFAQQQSSIASSLANDNQRRMFTQHAEVVNLGFQSDLYRHQAKETQVFNGETRQNTIDLAVKDSAAHPYDDQVFQTNAQIVGKTVVAQGKDLGLSGEALANYAKDKMLSINSQALTYRTQAMLADGNPHAAEDFFNQHKEEFDPNARAQLEPHIKTAVDAQVTRTGASQIVDDTVAKRGGSLAALEASEGTVIKQAQSAAEAYRPGDAVLKDQYVTEALRYLNQKKTVVQGQNNASVQSILGEVQNGASSVSTLSPQGQRAYSYLPPATQMQIDAKLKKADNDPTFGAERYYQLSSMAANPETRAQFRNLDLTKELGGVSSHYWNQLVATQNSMTKQDAKQLDKDMNFSKMQRDTSIMLRPYLDSLGKNKQLVDDTKSQFYGRLQESEQQFHDDPKNGRWPTTPERQKLAASLLTQVTTPSGHWYSTDKTQPAFQANDLSNATVQVSKNDKPVLQQAFQDVNGRAPNDDELTQWHTQLQQQAFKATGQYLPARDLANLYKQYAAQQKAKQPQSQAGQIPR